MDSVGRGTRPDTAGYEFLHISDTLLWQCVCETFMTGVFHAIGSRVSALSGIATMASMGQELDGTLLSHLEDEVELLTDILQASRGLPRAPRGIGGPSQIADLIPRVIRLLELNLETRGVEIEYRGPDAGGLVELDGTTLTHALATLLTCLAWRAGTNGATRLQLELRIDGTSVEVRGALAGMADGLTDLDQLPRAHNIPAPEAIEIGLGAIRAIAATHGGTLRAPVHELPEEFSLELPALGG